MDSSNRYVSGDTTNSYGQTAVPEYVNLEAVKEYVDAYSERLLDKREGYLRKGKGKIHDTLPPLPPKAKRLFQPTISGDSAQENAVQRIMAADHSRLSSLSFGPLPGQCNEPDDISTESDERLEEDTETSFGPLPVQSNEPEDISTESDERLEADTEMDSVDITRDFIHMAKGHDGPSSSLNDCNVDILASKENKVDGGVNLTQNLLGDIGSGKPCSCSFCLKAAHMWTDVAFQDTRGRLTELQRSKKRAKDQIAKITEDDSKKSKFTKLEFDLMQQWKMLFLHTQDTVAHEIAQLQSDLELRTKQMMNCKKDLENASKVLPDKP